MLSQVITHIGAGFLGLFVGYKINTMNQKRKAKKSKIQQITEELLEAAKEKGELLSEKKAREAALEIYRSQHKSKKKEKPLAVIEVTQEKLDELVEKVAAKMS